MVYVPSTYISLTDRPDIEHEADTITLLIVTKKWNIYCRCPHPVRVGIYTTSRNLTQNIGMCRYNYDEYAILLSPHLLRMPIDKIRAVLIHEIAHAFTHCGHREDWKWLNNLVRHHYGLPDGARCEPDKEIVAACCNHKERKYVVGCPCCGATISRRIQSEIIKHPEFYKCRKCHQELVRIK